VNYETKMNYGIKWKRNILKKESEFLERGWTNLKILREEPGSRALYGYEHILKRINHLEWKKCFGYSYKCVFTQKLLFDNREMIWFNPVVKGITLFQIFDFFVKQNKISKGYEWVIGSGSNIDQHLKEINDLLEKSEPEIKSMLILQSLSE
jgi:hypothetical protein